MIRFIFAYVFIVANGIVVQGQTARSCQGYAQNNTYMVKYFDEQDRDFSKQIDSMLIEFDHVFSLFDSSSVISRINANKTTQVPPSFISCFDMSQMVSRQTDGAFDITVAPIVSVWGFSAEPRTDISDSIIDSLMQFVGYTKVKIKNQRIVKDDPRVRINFNAIAQGLATDVIAEFLDKAGITNYIVEIGGEILAKGSKADGSLWIVGIESPMDNQDYNANELSMMVQLSNVALATSGNYRNYYVEDGVKYSHTINPKTGQPARNTLLSATVIAPSSALADAYATACMVMGIDKAKTFIDAHKQLSAFLMYSDQNGAIVQYISPRFEQYLLHK